MKMTKKQKNILLRVCVAAVLWIGLYIITAFCTLPWWAEMLLFFVPYFVVGYDVVWSACKKIARGQVLDEEFLMVVATVGAFAVQEYPEGVAVMILYQLGELFQSIAVGKSRKSIQSLMELQPETATVLRENKEISVSPDEVEIGETIVVRAGEKIPLDGIVLSGRGAVNTSMLTGESIPADKKEGDTVMSGCISVDGIFYIKVTADYENGTVAKILEMVENAADKKAKSENFIKRFAKFYTPTVVACALLLCVLPPLFLGIKDWGVWQEWIKRACSFLVISCPCALVISVPLSFFGGIGGCAKKGILIKGSDDLERLAKVGTVVFDKTGTLTEGKFSVTKVCSDIVEENKLLEIAALCECYSNHPVAQAIVSSYRGELPKEKVGEVREYAGMGIEATIDGIKTYVGNSLLMEKAGVNKEPISADGTVIYVARENEYIGYITVSDTLKKETHNAILSLKKIGIKNLVMLTGDNESTAKQVAAMCGIDHVRAGLLPYQKVEETEKLLGGKQKVVFVGDGINDAPVLMRADVGISMGAMGSDAAIEASDVVLTDDNPKKVSTAIRCAKKTMSIVYTNIIFALAVKIIVLFLSAFGLSSMWLAVFADVGVCVLAVLNAMRSLRCKE